jgi:hypothetical protein
MIVKAAILQGAGRPPISLEEVEEKAPLINPSIRLAMQNAQLAQLAIQLAGDESSRQPRGKNVPSSEENGICAPTPLGGVSVDRPQEKLRWLVFARTFNRVPKSALLAMFAN